MGTAVLEKKGAPAKTAKTKKPKAKQSEAKRPKRSATKPRMTQMNVRINAETKKQGDRALERIGLSPSEAVRALWEFAARHANEPASLQSLLAALEAEEDVASIDENQRNLAEEGWALVDSFRKINGLVCTVPEDDDERMAYYKQLREEAYWERLAERGLA